MTPHEPAQNPDDRTPAQRRARISPGELAAVCSRYDLGIVRSVRELQRGASGSAKAILTTSKGVFLLKRRGHARHPPHPPHPSHAPINPARVALSHEIQLFLADHAFPTPRLIGTRGDNNSILHLGGRLYELAEFVPGTRYDGSLEQTHSAGHALGRLHRLLLGFDAPRATAAAGDRFPTATYHRRTEVATWLRDAEARSGDPDLRRTTRSLRLLYEDAGRNAEPCALPALAPQIVHGDWHPGNLIFRATTVAAVLDFDSAALAPRATDFAYGALQFWLGRSALRPGPALEPGSTPAPPLDDARLTAFSRGYHEGWGEWPIAAEARCVPWFMLEALIAEAAGPVAATGRFGELDGPAFLRLVEGKAAWLRDNAERLAQLVGGVPKPGAG